MENRTAIIDLIDKVVVDEITSETVYNVEVEDMDKDTIIVETSSESI